MTPIYIAGLAPVASLALLALSPSRSMSRSVLILLVLAGAVAAWLVGRGDLLGRPLRTRHSLVQEMTGTVLDAEIRDGKAIYLYVLRDGEEVPFSLEVQWSIETAKDLMDAQRDGNGDDRWRFQSERSLDTLSYVFHPMPQPRAPAKQREASPGIFEPPEDAIL